MHRTIQILVVLIAFVCHALSRNHDAVGKNNANSLDKESKRLNPV